MPLPVLFDHSPPHYTPPMRRLLLPMLLAGCQPDPIYPVRRPELRLDISCVDTGPGCRDLYLEDVPFERTEELSFSIWNDGELPLNVTLTLDGTDFAVSPTEASVASGGHKAVQVAYTPTEFADRECTLRLDHDALGGPIVLTLHGTTDADADDDTYRTEQAPSGDDCNDFNPTVHPDADEVWYDGIDQDCDDWSDYDQDRDGHDLHTRPDGDDCDDEDAGVYPGAPDTAGDEIDQDCDALETCYKDYDNDGYRPDAGTERASSDLDCDDSREALATDPAGDCDDADGSVAAECHATPPDEGAAEVVFFDADASTDDAPSADVENDGTSAGSCAFTDRPLPLQFLTATALVAGLSLLRVRRKLDGRPVQTYTQSRTHRARAVRST